MHEYPALELNLNAAITHIHKTKTLPHYPGRKFLWQWLEGHHGAHWLHRKAQRYQTPAAGPMLDKESHWAPETTQQMQTLIQKNIQNSNLNSIVCSWAHSYWNKAINPQGKCYRETHLCDLAVCGKEDPGERIRQAAIISSKQATGLIHVSPQLEHLHTWKRTWRL